jgi:hypothetical protein
LANHNPTENSLYLAYIDDVLIATSTIEEHISRMDELFDRLRCAGFKVTAGKSYLFQKEVRYLGHLVSKDGIRPFPEKIEAVKNWGRPENLKQLRSFLGTIGYYRKFIPNFSHKAAKLTDLIKDKVPWFWGDDEQGAFETLKKYLIEAPVLTLFRKDRQTIVDTDASSYGIGGVLSQIDEEGIEHVIAYTSRVLTDRERQESAIYRELLAVVDSCAKFRPYILQQRVLLRTDHQPLEGLLKSQKTGYVFTQMILKLQEYEFDLKYRKGTKHANADGLSRMLPEPEHSLPEIETIAQFIDEETRNRILIDDSI